MPNPSPPRPHRSLALVVGLLAACSPADETPTTTASYVGRQTCVECHPQEHQRWQGSHHDLAMQPASAATVLGDFGDVTFEHFGTKTRFYRKDGRFMVHTDGPDGKLADFEVSHVFGVYPLQSYLVDFPRGRRQALSICWDARPAQDGGQRWFHLYQERITHDDPLHWTGRAQNWNYMCANCHSTNLRKNYDIASDTYATSWSEIDVSCETCHGPASHHLAWAKQPERNFRHFGFAGPIKNDVQWRFAAGAVTASRTGGEHAAVQTGTCARCHSRRSTIQEDHAHGRVHDTERVALLDPLLYHADGQILDEVYVYGSFVQSKMFHAGVTCTDCHDPHSLRPHAPGNALCVRCHQAATFDTPDHHHHAPGTAGANCVACHMPTRNYMVVDPRLDHSIRVPRPDLSARIGTPNACNGCHRDRDARWAADAIAQWKPDYRPPPHYAEALHAGREGRPDAGARLTRVIDDKSIPAIARATALTLLQNRMDAATVPVVRGATADPDPLVRRGAVEALEQVPVADRLAIAGPLLSDPVRAVRIAAARVLAEVPADRWTAELRPRFEAAMREYVAFQQLNGDQPWAHTNLGIVQFQQGDFAAAEASYRRAIRLDRRWVQAYVNLADLHRDRGQEAECEQVLRDGLRQLPGSAELNHALGLVLHRRGNTAGALLALERAARQRRDVPRYAYTYGVALHSTGKVADALRVLAAAHQLAPEDFDILFALASYQLAAGNTSAARSWAAKLYELAPGNPQVQELMRDLQRRR